VRRGARSERVAWRRSASVTPTATGARSGTGVVADRMGLIFKTLGMPELLADGSRHFFRHRSNERGKISPYCHIIRQW